MNRKTLLITIGISLVLIAVAFMSGKAYASTGCFSDTNGHWAETYICWLKDNGISSGYGNGTYGPENNIKRSEMAVMLFRQAEVPPSTGLIAITEGHGNWRAENPLNTLIEVYGDASLVKSPSGGSGNITLDAGIPTILYGRKLQLSGVELCFEASTTAYLDNLEINMPINAIGPGEKNTIYTNSTDRTSKNCTIYGLASPVTLDYSHSLNLTLTLKWTDTSSSFKLGRTTFYLHPSSDVFVAPWSFDQAGINLP